MTQSDRGETIQQVTSHPESLGEHSEVEESMDADIKSLFQALPTKSKIESLITRLEESYHKEIQRVCEEVSELSAKVTDEELVVSELTQRVWALEKSRDAYRNTATFLQLHVEELEDRGR